MSIFQKTKGLMLGTRLKRLGDRFLQDVSKIYKIENIPFEPSWFPVFFLLNENNKMRVTEIADELEVTQSAASQMISILKKKNYVEIEKDKKDKRIKVVFLSKEGVKLLEEVRPLWETMLMSLEEMENLKSLLKSLEKFENTLNETPLYNRIKEKLGK